MANARVEALSSHCHELVSFEDAEVVPELNGAFGERAGLGSSHEVDHGGNISAGQCSRSWRWLALDLGGEELVAHSSKLHGKSWSDTEVSVRGHHHHRLAQINNGGQIREVFWAIEVFNRGEASNSPPIPSCTTVAKREV
jgi:hypothetical protein